MFLLTSVSVNLEAVPPPRLMVASARVVVSEPESMIMFPV